MGGNPLALPAEAGALLLARPHNASQATGAMALRRRTNRGAEDAGRRGRVSASSGAMERCARHRLGPSAGAHAPSERRSTRWLRWRRGARVALCLGLGWWRSCRHTGSQPVHGHAGHINASRSSAPAEHPLDAPRGDPPANDDGVASRRLEARRRVVLVGRRCRSPGRTPRASNREPAPGRAPDPHGAQARHGRRPPCERRAPASSARSGRPRA